MIFFKNPPLKSEDFIKIGKRQVKQKESAVRILEKSNCALFFCPAYQKIDTAFSIGLCSLIV